MKTKYKFIRPERDDELDRLRNNIVKEINKEVLRLVELGLTLSEATVAVNSHLTKQLDEIKAI